MTDSSAGTRSSAAQAASRKNGTRSKGPKSPTGKARSSRNALKHGLRAARLLPTKLPTWVAEVERELLTVLASAGMARHGLVDQIIHASFLVQEVDDLIDATWLHIIKTQTHDDAATQNVWVCDLHKLLRYRSRFRASRDMAMKKLAKIVS